METHDTQLFQKFNTKMLFMLKLSGFIWQECILSELSDQLSWFLHSTLQAHTYSVSSVWCDWISSGWSVTQLASNQALKACSERRPLKPVVHFWNSSSLLEMWQLVIAETEHNYWNMLRKTSSKPKKCILTVLPLWVNLQTLFCNFRCLKFYLF